MCMKGKIYENKKNIFAVDMHIYDIAVELSICRFITIPS